MSSMSRNALFLLRGLLILAALGSIGAGLMDALQRSNDFQWSPTRLMWQGVNPYQAYLDHDPRLILDQAPNYGHFLYVVLAPVAALPWEWAKLVWALCNLAMFAWVAWVFWRAMDTPAQRALWYLSLALIAIGFPIKLTLSNGQQTLLCLFGLTLMLEGRDRPGVAGFGLALLMTKYSFGVPVAAAYLLTGRWRAVAIGAAWSVGGWVFLAWRTHSPVFETLFMPLVVARQDVPTSFFDLLSVGRMLDKQGSVPIQWSAAVIIGINLAYGLWQWSQRHFLAEDRWGVHRVLAASSLLSLGTIYHLGYDLAVSLFPAGVLILIDQHADRRSKMIICAIFLTYWLLPRFARFMPHDPLKQPIVVSLLSLGLVVWAFWILTGRRAKDANGTRSVEFSRAA
jgi:Glycosyltransferase family 87